MVDRVVAAEVETLVEDTGEMLVQDIFARATMPATHSSKVQKMVVRQISIKIVE